RVVDELCGREATHPHAGDLAFLHCDPVARQQRAAEVALDLRAERPVRLQGERRGGVGEGAQRALRLRAHGLRRRRLEGIEPFRLAIDLVQRHRSLPDLNMQCIASFVGRSPRDWGETSAQSYSKLAPLRKSGGGPFPDASAEMRCMRSNEMHLNKAKVRGFAG